MNFCVLVKISKYNLSLWYQSGTSLYSPLPNQDNIIPLYFYVNGNDFIFGKQARERFYTNDPNAFGNYFDLIKDPSRYFNYFNNQKPIKQLLYIAIEQLLSNFIKNELFRAESLDELRSNFPLRFIYEADIEDKEKNLVETLFLDAGYNNIDGYEFQYELLEVLIKNNQITNNPVLILEGIDNNLYLNLFESNKLIAHEKLENNGADPRLKILAELIVEYISVQNSFLSFEKEKEIAYILPRISNLLDDSINIIKGETEFSNGSKYWFKINQRNIDERLLYDSNDVKIYNAIDDILKSNGIKPDNLKILLASEEVNTFYFINKLHKKYPSVIGIEPNHFTDVMKQIFNKIIQNKYTAIKVPEIPALPFQSKIPDLPAVRQNTVNHTVKQTPVLPPAPAKKKEETPKVKPKIPELKPTNTGSKKVVLPPLPPKKN